MNEWTVEVVSEERTEPASVQPHTNKKGYSSFLITQDGIPLDCCPEDEHRWRAWTWPDNRTVRARNVDWGHATVLLDGGERTVWFRLATGYVRVLVVKGPGGVEFRADGAEALCRHIRRSGLLRDVGEALQLGRDIERVAAGGTP